MPIYEESYSPWYGELKSQPQTWWVIARTGIRLLWKKWMIVLVLLSYIPFFVRAVQIYLMTRFGDKIEIAKTVKGLQINARFFHEFLQSQAFFLLLIFIVAGAGLIANDRKFKALFIYFSRPVNFWDYIIGKFTIVGFYGALITLVPGLLLFLIRILLARDASFFNKYFWIPFSITGYVLIVLFTMGGLILALSATSRNATSAAIFFFSLITFPDVLQKILYKIHGIGLISLNADLKQVGSLLFGLRYPFHFSVWLGFAVLIGIVLISLVVLRIKVKPTEVVR